ncbi:LOW QUALITY PROTEIN: cardiac-enriched FHL2-interacting protein [Dasypus novemcinctus]|uniref:LOW QUALITY PROTEIN: cardiac-enriched FHL2-interacting protein n=1 Tax=Dasypus novemcinctus TaxID=9361 RepID=UPI00265E3509|nr:LOW QUALITY PROTEIN: cardiac-enriched FHL2-interacting protein [Dasypus novemcinctus]
MQGNKKCGDGGFSDTSSIGSMLDDADREVSSLTDRAFRSLCVSEDAFFHEPELAGSPDITHRVSGSLPQAAASHAHRKSGLWGQLSSQGTEHAGWAATFQQFPKYVQGEGKYPKGSPPPTPAQRKLEARAPGPRSGPKPASKVSSLIRSFDRPEGQSCDSGPPPGKPPALKIAPKFAPLPESGVNFCFDSAFLTVRRVPAEVSNPHAAGRTRGERGSPMSPDAVRRLSGGFTQAPERPPGSFEAAFHAPAPRPAPGELGRAPERVHKGTFLHSENSAFESWTAHQPRRPGRKDAGEPGAGGRAPGTYEDKPSVAEARPAEGEASPGRAGAGCSQGEGRPATGALSTPGPWEPRDPGALRSQPDPQAKPTQAPWRKARAGKGRRDPVPEALEEKAQAQRGGLPSSRQGQCPEDAAPALSAGPEEQPEAPFDISKLLTPVIRCKAGPDLVDGPPAPATPAPPGQPNGLREEPGGGCAPDSYKARAPRLLFNLKDVRRCVKSTYSPSALSKGLDGNARGKVDGRQEPASNGAPLPNGLEESPPSEPSDEGAAGAPAGAHAGIQEHPEAGASSASVGHPAAPSSPPAVATAPFCANGEATETNGDARDDADGDAGVGPASPGCCPDSSGHCLRKRLSLRLCSRDPQAGKATEPPQAPRLENGFSRSVSQETDPEREAGLRDPRVSPGPLSPEEEDVFYSDSQSDFTPGLKAKAKFSTSSSDQSFASFDDQQKTWPAEGQRGEKEKAAGIDGPPTCALSDGRACAEEQGEPPQGAGAGPPGGVPRAASPEEARFRGSWTGGNKDPGLSQVQDLPTSPSSTSNKRLLFAIKDNTLRATPVIKPILLPLLRTLSSEDAPGGGHKEEGSPRSGENSRFCPLEGPEKPCAPSPGPLPPAGVQGAPARPAGRGGAGGTARLEVSQPAAKGAPPPPPPAGDALEDGQGRCPRHGEQGAPGPMPAIALPQDDPPAVLQPGRGWEEQMPGFGGPFLSTPRMGPQGRRPFPGDSATSLDPSSLEDSGACSPATGGNVWDEVPRVPGDAGWLPPQELPRASPWTGPAQATRREALTHAPVWAAGDPQLEASAEDLRALSPGGAWPEAVTSSEGFPERAEAPAQVERAAGKPPAVPPKTEKALRRAKKLASKRRKTAQRQGAAGEPPGDVPPPREPRPRCPAVRSLPPPAHRHSVSGFLEHVRRGPGGPPSATPPPPYPATQKVLQDPQSGEYFLFDLPLQVKIKTFYDPDTGRYVRVSLPAAEGDAPEPPAQDALAAPYVLYPGFQPLPVTSLMPLRCSSQLSAPTYLRQGPHTPLAAGELWDSDTAQRAPRPYRDAAGNSAGPLPNRPPGSPEEEGGEAPSLEIISTDDLEDFATEGIS